MVIKRIGRSFETTNLFIHSVSLSKPDYLGIHFISGLSGPIEYDTVSQIYGESLEPENVPQSLIEIGKTHVHEVKNVTPDEVRNYNPGSGHDEGYTPVYETKHFRDTIYGKIVPKS